MAARLVPSGAGPTAAGGGAETSAEPGRSVTRNGRARPGGGAAAASAGFSRRFR